MSILVKVLLFPIKIILTILVHISCFLVESIGGLLSIISSLLFLIAAVMFGAVIFGNDNRYLLQPAIVVTVISFLISPYGLPKCAAWLVVKVDDLNNYLKAI